jgi:peptidoglycan/xylan/chitin deacetylase (PgdA/CDA1 family)
MPRRAPFRPANRPFHPRILAGLPVPQNLTNPAHTLVEDFENTGAFYAGGGVAALAADAVHYITGTQGIQLTTDVTTTGYISRDSLSWNLAAAQCFRLHIYIPDVTKLGSFSFNLGNDAGGWTNYLQGSLSPGNFMNGWNALEFLPADLTVNGTGTLSSPIQRFRLYIQPQAGQTCVATFDRFTAGALGQPAILWGFDDGSDTIYSQAFPILRSHNMRGTCYLPSDLLNTGGYMSTAQLRELWAAGWIMGNHGKTHVDLTTLSEAQQETELSTCETVLNGLGLTGGTKYVAYPLGGNDANTMTAMAATGMLTGRTTKETLHEMLPLGGATNTGSLYTLRQKGYLYNTTTLATAKGYVDTIITRGQILVLLNHRLVVSPGSANEWAISDFAALADYIASKQLPCLTIDDFYKLQSGPLTVPRIL